MNNSHAGKDRYLENMADYARAHGCTADVCPHCGTIMVTKGELNGVFATLESLVAWIDETEVEHDN